MQDTIQDQPRELVGGVELADTTAMCSSHLSSGDAGEAPCQCYGGPCSVCVWGNEKRCVSANDLSVGTCSHL